MGRERTSERERGIEEETALANEALEQIWDILEALPIVSRLAVCTLLKRTMPDLDMALDAVRNRRGGFD